MTEASVAVARGDIVPTEGGPRETKRIHLIIRIFGILCILGGVAGFALMSLLAAVVAMGFAFAPAGMQQAFDGNASLSLGIFIAAILLQLVSSVGTFVLGVSLVRSHRRNAARWARTLVLLTILEVLADIMFSGVEFSLTSPGARLAVLIALSVTIDPSLREERQAKRRAETIEDLIAARRGMLGRDLSGAGYIKLNFFNLFWTFAVCSVIGLILEVIWHMVVVEPGVYQDRAGLLYGPFSPIYGFGALIMTVALNRLYDDSPLLVFLASSVIGGLFEVAVSLFMQLGFGAVAWDYTDAMLFGVVPDPVAALFDGRTSTLFACIWGVLGLVWIKALLPQLLRLINLIPWKLRYGLTAVCALLMMANGILTLLTLDCWYERMSGIAPTTAIEMYCAEHYDNEYMQHRFQSMTITPDDSARADAAVEDHTEA